MVTAVRITDEAASSTPYLNGPQAVETQDPHRTYVAFLGLDRDLYVTYYDHDTETVATKVLADTRQLSTPDDNHSAPSIDVDASGIIHIAWGNHDEVGIRYVTSDNPHDISAWTAVSLSPITTYNYIRVAPSGDIYIFYRASTGQPAGGGFNSGHGATFPAHEFGGFIKSTDGGTSWSAEAAFIDTTGSPEAQSDVYLESVIPNADGTFDIAWTVARGATHDDTRINFYHAVFDPADDTLHAADGTDLGAIITWAEHPTCLAATDSEVDSAQVYRDGRIVLGFRSVSGSSGKVAIWDSGWTVNDTPTVAAGVIYSTKDGLRQLSVADTSGDGDRDLVLYDGSEDATSWLFTETLEVGVAGGFNNTGAILNRGGESVGLFGEKDSANDPNDATASDLIPLWLVLDSSLYEPFNGPDNDPWPVERWDQDGPGGGDTVIDTNRGKAHGSTGNPNSGGRGKGRNGKVANQELTGTFQLCETGEPCNGALWLQTSDDWAGLDWPTQGYGVRLPSDSDSATLLRASGGTVATLDTATWPRDTGLKQFRFRRQSNQVRFRIWDDGDPEPETWTLSAQDSVITPDAVGAFQVAYTCPTAPSVDACALFDEVLVEGNDQQLNPESTTCQFGDGFSSAFANCSVAPVSTTQVIRSPRYGITRMASR